MDDETTTSAEAGTGNRHLSRRTVLRAAGHAAWVVPAIQVVSMAPAFAATSDILLLTPAPTGDWTRPGGGADNYMDATVTVKNTSTADTTVALALTLTFPNVYVWSTTGGGVNRILTISLVTGTWIANPVIYSGTGTGRTAEVTFTATAQPVAGASSALGFRATTPRRVGILTAIGSTDAVSVQATATNHIGASTTFNPTA